MTGAIRVELAERFEAERPRLRAVAYRMLGSLAEADDAVQEAWPRLARAEGIDNQPRWLTTVVGRICLDMLRTRTARAEVSLPDPVVTRAEPGPEDQAALADEVGLAMLVVLDTLSPAERLAFVLHDMFAVPFDDIAAIVGRSPAATMQLASRGRRRVADAPAPDRDLGRQRAAVDAFLAASRTGDFDALVAVLDPDVVLRVDQGPGRRRLVRGAAGVAGQALTYQPFAAYSRVVLVNGTVGLLNEVDGKPRAVMSFTLVDGRAVGIEILADLDRLARLDLPAA